MRKFLADAQLIAEAHKIQTGANVHSIAACVVYYLYEVEIYNRTGSAKSLDFIQFAEHKLRELVYPKETE